MASAYQRSDNGRWYASYRPIAALGTRRVRVPIPPRRLRRGHEKRDADAYATECEHYSRLLETAPTRADILHAQHLGIIDDDHAVQLRAGVPLRTGRAHDGPTTLEEAWLEHPAATRLAKTDHAQWQYLRGALRRFVEWSGIAHIGELDLETIQRWIAELTRRGLAYDTRRHYLMPLRQASRMAAAHGLPDVVSGLRLDSTPADATVDYWPLDALLEGIPQLTDARIAAVVLLGAFMGLRATEIQRLRPDQVGHGGEADVIQIWPAKTRPSHRVLPVPEPILRVLQLIMPADPALPLLRARKRRSGQISGFTKGTYRDQVKPELARVTGIDLAVKCLRASFATWASDHELPPAHIEAYLGHSASGIADITQRHYLAKSNAKKLRPTAAAIAEVVGPAVDQVIDRLTTSDESPYGAC